MPPILNYPVAVIFIAMAIASLAAGPGNWPNLPFLILMAVLFVREKAKKEFLTLGEKLMFPALCFAFTTNLMQALVASEDPSALWVSGILAAGSGLGTYYNVVIKPQRIEASGKHQDDGARA